MSRTDRVSLLGFDLVIERGVFHPSLFFSSTILGRRLAQMPLQRKRVLDMGTGSGILALCAARGGASVLAVDVNPQAVACAGANAAANRLQDRIRVLQSDLFAAIPDGERFDLVLWNPPFYPGEPLDDAQRAWRAGESFDVIHRFGRSAAGFLAPGGILLVILSSDVNEEEFFQAFPAFAITPHSAHRRFFEVLTVYELSASRPGT